MTTTFRNGDTIGKDGWCGQFNNIVDDLHDSIPDKYIDKVKQLITEP
jgi:hypothetical protein